MNILIVVAARAGSKRVKNKNARLLAGKPLLAYTIEQAVRWGGHAKLIFSSDSKKMAALAKSYGADVIFKRPAELASDRSGKMDVIRHALKAAEDHYQERYDAVLDLDVTNPIRRISDIEGIVQVYKKFKPDCVFSVVAARKNPYFNMVEVDSRGKVQVCKKLAQSIKRTQDAPRVYDMNASMYVHKRAFLLDIRNQLPYAKKAMIYEMDESAAFDIDSEFDFQLVEFLIKSGKAKL